MTTTFEALEIEIRAEEIYAAVNRLGIPWERCLEHKRRSCRDVARNEIRQERMLAEAARRAAV